LENSDEPKTGSSGGWQGEQRKQGTDELTRASKKENNGGKRYVAGLNGRRAAFVLTISKKKSPFIPGKRESGYKGSRAGRWVSR